MKNSELRHRSAGIIALLVLTVSVVSAFQATAYAKDRLLMPRRLSSVGDSMSAGADAEYYGPNPNASWVNGYYGFWEWMSGFTNVSSHNQRITAIWGSRARTNYMDAAPGSQIFDIVKQARQAVNQKAHYVTVLLGGGDVCQDYPWQIPTDPAFEAAFRAGMEILKNGLPHGSTIYVLGIVDVRHLYDVAQEKQLLGIVDCETVWAATLFGKYFCATMLSPLNTEADREYTRSRNIAFNGILERVTAEYQASDEHHYYYFSDTLFNYPFIEAEVSDLDCFHPSAQGQTTISEITWQAGPFSTYQK